MTETKKRAPRQPRGESIQFKFGELEIVVHHPKRFSDMTSDQRRDFQAMLDEVEEWGQKPLLALASPGNFRGASEPPE